VKDAFLDYPNQLVGALASAQRALRGGVADYGWVRRNGCCLGARPRSERESQVSAGKTHRTR
jgi:hypothetical protein